MMIHYVELIEVITNNLYPFITNGVIIIDYVFKIDNKWEDEILVLFGKRSQCLGICLVTYIWYIHIRDGYKVSFSI